MPKYTYKGQSADGELVKGEIDAPDKFALARKMKKKGVFVIKAKKIAPKRNFLIALEGLVNKVKTMEKIVFIRNLGSMIKAGLPLMRALSVLERQTKNKFFKKIIKNLSNDITKGGELSSSMVRFPGVFSSLTVAMVKAGEKSGNIAESLKIVSEQLEKSYVLYKRVRGALIYPTIIFITMIVIGILMLMFVVPTLTQTFEELGVELPMATKMLIFISDLLRNNAIISLIGFVFIGVLVYLGIKTPRGTNLFEKFILHFPIIGNLVKQVNSARTTRTLSSLLSSGVDIVEAISITRDVLQNTHYKKILKEAGERVSKGVALSVIFMEYDKLYPTLVGEMSSVGEETGKLSEMLLNVAVFYEDEVSRATKDLSTIIEPILMIVIGGAVGFFAFSMITPLYSVLGGI